MSKALRWILAITGVFLIIAIFVMATAYAFLWRTVTADNGVAQIAQLGENVRIVRDKEAVPHIIGKSIIDVAAAQGFVHAQERLWQMENFRMAGQGRLSEIFGEATIGTDKFLRTLNFTRHARQSYEHLKPETKEILQAYARGINAYITRQRVMFEPALPPEFIILGHQPEPWQGWHSLLTGKIMALTLGQNMSKEIRRLALASKGFNPGEINDLVPYDPSDNPPALPDLRDVYGFPKTGKVTGLADPSDKTTDMALINGFEMPWPIGVTASNNWVISGSRTKSGKVLLANDPHLGLSAPSIWYMVHLSWQVDGQTRNLVGASLPSVPFVMLGRNDDIAWGFTTSNLDSQDLYIERQNPENDNEYLTENGWLPFEERQEIIKVSGRADIKYNIRSTHHGPILPGNYKNLSNYLPKQHVAALKWIAMSDDDTSMDSIVAIINSNNVSSFMHELRRFVSPMQTMVVGDSTGNIGLLAPARVAIRADNNDIMGRAPSPGWLPRYEWQGYLDFNQMPEYKNPASGILYSANSKFVGSEYRPHITYDWSENFRRQRIQALIGDTNKSHDVANMIAAQGDDYSGALVQFRDEALSLLRAGVSIDPNIIKAISNWDGRMEKSSPLPLIMMAWFRQVSKALLEDDLGADYKLFARGNITIVLAILGSGGARDWCDNRKLPGQQNCSTVVLDSLKTSLDQLRKDFGKNWQNWRWGKAHIAYSEHRPFAKVPPLNRLFNVEVESAGGPYTLRRGQTDLGSSKPYYNRHATSFRAIYDFADLDDSLFIHTTGQSGNFMSPYYRNFADRWSEMKYFTISTKRQDFEKDKIGVWTVERK